MPAVKGKHYVDVLDADGRKKEDGKEVTLVGWGHSYNWDRTKIERNNYKFHWGTNEVEKIIDNQLIIKFDDENDPHEVFPNKGDSGGPMLIVESRQKKLAGVASKSDTTG